MGVALASALGPGMVIVLVGGLGAGKTALTQGIAAGLGVAGRVTSPTFTMVASHPTDGRQEISTLLHADLYRVSSGEEADDLAIAEQLEAAALAVVEWGDVAPDVLGADRIKIEILVGPGDDDRELRFEMSDSSVDEGILASAVEPWTA